ncbi:hypothetical protein GWI33_018120 [Rhynchophorus ferrugineus]|uniref:Uncharacterized protein n=1 Tax=Rhynchophorus ferrugineus TaxID=354439 RepID=A0A834M6Q7_RHYFE|nr:hypothetical protein GWI33_018120 [Rhynchophorus ferrugineus]
MSLNFSFLSYNKFLCQRKPSNPFPTLPDFLAPPETTTETTPIVTGMDGNGVAAKGASGLEERGREIFFRTTPTPWRSGLLFLRRINETPLKRDYQSRRLI